MNRPRLRTLAALVTGTALAAIGSGVSAPAGAFATGCVRNGNTAEVGLPGSEALLIQNVGGNLRISAPSFSDEYCGGATVTNVDSIAITGSVDSDYVLVYLDNGGIAPGASGESTTPEIEISMDLDDGEDFVSIFGTSVEDNVTGNAGGFNLNGDTDHNDVTAANVENHQVFPGGGDDLVNMSNRGTSYPFAVQVYGDEGNDTIVGSANGDLLVGQGGDDRLSGLGGGDNLQGGTGMDTIDGRDGADSIDGGADTDILDLIRADTGADVDLLSGTATSDGSTDTVAGVENVAGSNFDDVIRGTNTENVLNGRAGNDEIRGRTGVDTVIGGDGNDFVYGGTGADLVLGGKGNDKLSGERDTDVCEDTVGTNTFTLCETVIS